MIRHCVIWELIDVVPLNSPIVCWSMSQLVECSHLLHRRGVWFHSLVNCWLAECYQSVKQRKPIAHLWPHCNCSIWLIASFVQTLNFFRNGNVFIRLSMIKTKSSAASCMTKWYIELDHLSSDFVMATKFCSCSIRHELTNCQQSMMHLINFNSAIIYYEDYSFLCINVPQIIAYFAGCPVTSIVIFQSISVNLGD